MKAGVEEEWALPVRSCLRRGRERVHSSVEKCFVQVPEARVGRRGQPEPKGSVEGEERAVHSFRD